MKASHVLFALAAVGLPVAAAYAYSRREIEASSSAPSPAAEPSPIGFVPPSEEPAPPGFAAEPPAPSELPLPTGKDLLQQGVKLFGGDALGATVALGLKSLELQETAVRALGANEATQDTVRVLGPMATVGFLAQQGLQKGAEALGIKGKLAEDIGQVGGIAAATTAVLGPLGLPATVGIVSLKLAGEGVSAVIGELAGKEAEKAVRGVVSEFDPFKNGSVANQVIGGIGDLIFGERPTAPPPAPPALSPEELERIRVQAENNERAAAAAAAAREKQLEKKGKGKAGASKYD